MIDRQGAGTELFHMQAIPNPARLHQRAAALFADLKRGMKIDLTFPEHPGKTFQGTLVRTADAIDPASRTLLVEVDVDNRSGELMPGSLAQVHFKTASAGPTFIVPAAALIFRREGMQVASGRQQQATVAHLVPVGHRRRRRRHSADRQRPQPKRPDYSGSARLADRRRKGDRGTAKQRPRRGRLDQRMRGHSVANRAGRIVQPSEVCDLTSDDRANRLAQLHRLGLVRLSIGPFVALGPLFACFCSPAANPSAPTTIAPATAPLLHTRKPARPPSSSLRRIRTAAHGSRPIPPTAC